MLNENNEITVEPEGVDHFQVGERVMYIGSRISSARCEAMEDLYKGSIQDIKEGCMIAVLVTEDARGYPFWIEKFMKVNKENEEVISTELHWYAIDTHTHLKVYTIQRWWFRKGFAKREKERVKM